MHISCKKMIKKLRHNNIMVYLQNIGSEVEYSGHCSTTNMSFCSNVQMLKPDFNSWKLNSNSVTIFKQNKKYPTQIPRNPRSIFHYFFIHNDLPVNSFLELQQESLIIFLCDLDKPFQEVLFLCRSKFLDIDFSCITLFFSKYASPYSKIRWQSLNSCPF